MSWQDRLREMVAAGGLLFAGCGADAGIPCGNAVSDPCICGRSGPECDAATACRASGGVWRLTATDSTGTHPAHCEMDGGVDGTASADGEADGS